jgi:hypothetical protein
MYITKDRDEKVAKLWSENQSFPRSDFLTARPIRQKVKIEHLNKDDWAKVKAL